MYSPRPSPLSSALLLLAACFFLVTVAMPQSSVPSQMTTDELAILLVSRLEARQIQAEKQVIYWKNIIESLKNEREQDKKNLIESSALLEKAESELKKSQADLMEISRLLALSRSDFEAYKIQAERQINALALEVRIYKTATRIAVPTAAVSLVVIAGRMIGWW